MRLYDSHGQPALSDGHDASRRRHRARRRGNNPPPTPGATDGHRDDALPGARGKKVEPLVQRDRALRPGALGHPVGRIRDQPARIRPQDGSERHGSAGDRHLRRDRVRPVPVRRRGRQPRPGARGGHPGRHRDAAVRGRRSREPGLRRRLRQDGRQDGRGGEGALLGSRHRLHKPERVSLLRSPRPLHRGERCDRQAALAEAMDLRPGQRIILAQTIGYPGEEG